MASKTCSVPLQKSFQSCFVCSASQQDIAAAPIHGIRHDEFVPHPIHSSPDDPGQHGDRLSRPSIFGGNPLQSHLEHGFRDPAIFSLHIEPGGTDVADLVSLRGTSCPVVSNHTLCDVPGRPAAIGGRLFVVKPV